AEDEILAPLVDVHRRGPGAAGLVAGPAALGLAEELAEVVEGVESHGNHRVGLLRILVFSPRRQLGLPGDAVSLGSVRPGCQGAARAMIRLRAGPVRPPRAPARSRALPA